MGVIEAPQWLLPAYLRSVKALGATAPAEKIHASAEKLIEMWNGPGRYFHNLRHAIDVLARVDELADESHNPDVMRLAAWYHGCVFSAATEQTYKHNGGEDEVASAAYAAQDLSSLGLPDRTVDRIGALILNLKRHNLPANDIDALALNDADLGTLAADPQVYKQYRLLVREEYRHIPARDYLQARLAIISKLLAREALFSSPLGARWEAPARQNLEAEQRRLSDELKNLESSTPPPMVEAESSHLEPLTDPMFFPEPSDDEEDSPTSSVSSDSTFRASLVPPVDGPTPSLILPVPAHGTTSPSSPPPAAVSASTPASTPLPPEIVSPEEDSSADSTPPSTQMSHAATMESCVEDLDLLLSKPRSGQAEPPERADRASAAQVERTRLAERVRQKAEEAKVLREARSGEAVRPPVPVSPEDQD